MGVLNTNPFALLKTPNTPKKTAGTLPAVSG